MVFNFFSVFVLEMAFANEHSNPPKRFTTHKILSFKAYVGF